MLRYNLSVFHDLAKAWLRTTMGQQFDKLVTPHELVKCYAIFNEARGCELPDGYNKAEAHGFEKAFGTTFKRVGDQAAFYTVIVGQFSSWVDERLTEEAQHGEAT